MASESFTKTTERILRIRHCAQKSSILPRQHKWMDSLELGIVP